MTERPAARDNPSASRVHAIAAGLSTAGMGVNLHPALAGLELVAVVEGPGERKIEVVVDQSGAAAIRSLISPDATASQIAGAIAGAVAALSPVMAPTNRRTHPPAQRRSPALVAGYDDAVADCPGDAPMPGPEDRLIDQEPAQDQPRPDPVDHGHQSPGPREQDQRAAYSPPDADSWREASQTASELRERLERLPLGHPSSPYKSDGSRKPPPPDLTKYELPLPDEPGWQPDPTSEDATPPASEADASLNDSRTQELTTGEQSTIDADEDSQTPELPLKKEDAIPASDADRPLDPHTKPVTRPDGSWEWNDCHLTPERALAGDRGLERCREAEGRDMDGSYGQHGLTPGMRRIEPRFEHGLLVDRTEEFALKSAGRFKEKLAKLVADEPDADTEELVSRINDGVRYTFCFPDDEYSSGVMNLCAALAREGYELYERKNAWADTKKSYKGINSTWRDWASGILFEVQIHTSTSWNAKQESHKEYEVIESLKSTAHEKMSARKHQDRIFEQVPVPPGAVDIPSYRKEGW